jgi:Copper type II ascorbate-dependent monooxygenase, C-terminal domain
MLPVMQPSVAGGGAAGSGGNAPASGAPGTTGPAAGGATPPTVDPPGTVTLVMDSFMLAAGQEIYKCQNFDNPFGSKDAAVQRIVTDMAPGSHHLHVYHMTTSATRTLEDCTIADFHPLMHAAGAPHVETTYPAGMAVKLLGTSGLRIQVHYLNTTAQALKVNATLKLTPVDSSTITKWVSELYFSRSTLSVPPGDGQTVSTSCTIPATYGPIGLIYGGSHMHMRGVHFVVKTSTGMSLGDSTQWDEPAPFVYDPPVMLNPGDSISWTCTYNNDTGKTLVFGESAQNNEMCIYLGRFFSAPDGAQLECQASGPTGMPFSRTY